MAEKKVKRKAVDKWKTKQWYTLLAPKIFDQKEIGKTPAQKPQFVEGRTIRVSLEKLTGDRKLRQVEVKFKVSEVEGQKAYTQILGHEISHGYMNRLVRRRRSKVDAIVTVQTRNKKARITMVTICFDKIDRNKEKAIRKIMVEELENTAKEETFEKLFQELVFGTISSKVFKRAKAIAGIKRIEVSKSRVLEG